MTGVAAGLAIGAAFVGVVVGIGWLRRLAVARAWLDVPNARSSHTVPTPRGAGLIIVIALIGATVLALAMTWIAPPLATAICVGGGAVAAVGWLDDRRGVSPWLRLIVHTSAAIVAVAAIGGIPTLRLGGSIYLGALGWFVALAVVVWCINLYNFMDGIDGLAGAEALWVGLVGGLLSLSFPAIAFIAFLVTATAAGFLWWNYPPARIFLGDVGSGFLGFLFAVVALASERSGGLPLALWLLLLGTFGFDATVTLLRRIVQGERWYSAHRTHAYQRLVVSGWSHARVIAAYMTVNVILAGLVVLAVQQPSRAAMCLIAGVLVLTVAYLLVERRQPMRSKAERLSVPHGS